MIKAILLSLFVALLMVGCGGDAQKPGQNSPESSQTSAEPLEAKTAEVPKIDLDDPETLDEITAEATVGAELQWRGKEGEALVFAKNKQKPYTGWNVIFHDNGQINHLIQYKNGKYDGLWVTWYESGQKNLESNYKDGKLNGLWVNCFENGQKRFEHNYKDGQKDGLATEWYKDGQKKLEANYKDGELDALLTVWYENGQKEAESNYKNGKPNGPAKSWYENGQRESGGNLKDGKRNGHWTGWYTSGRKSLEGKYKDGNPMTVEVWKPNGEKCPDTNVVNGNGVMVGYAENGQKVSESNYKDGKWDGPNTSRYANGQKMEQGNWKDGELNGLLTNWYENGQKQSEENFKDGRLWTAAVWKPNGEKCPDTNVVNGNGVWVVYRNDGKVWGRETFRDGSVVIDEEQLQLRGQEGEELYHALNQQMPYTGWAKLMHDNGQVESLTQYKDGQQDGPKTKWYENGQKMAEGNFKDNQLNGPLKSWYESGQIQEEANFKDGKQDGLMTSWYESGQMQEEANFKDGKQDGLMTSWYESGQMQKKANFKDGEQDGLGMSWYENGQMQEEVNWKKDERNGHLKSWYESGQIQEEGNYQDGKYDGLWTSWNENGQKMAEANFKDGKQDGLGMSWYENGQMQEEVNWKKDERNGHLKSWYESGQIQEEGNYQDGELNGLLTNWYENGQKQSEENYKDGKLMSAEAWMPNGEKCPHTKVVNGNGVVVGYAENGRKSVEGNFKDGKRDGLWVNWYESGQKKREETFKDHKLWTTEAWIPNGEKCPHTKVVNGNGVVVGYAENGRKSVEGNFKDGKQDGTWILYNEDGTEDFRITYKDGERANGAQPALDNRSDPIEDSLDHSDSPSPVSTLVATEAVRVEETPNGKTAEFTKIDLDDNETLNEIIAGAATELQERTKLDGTSFHYLPFKQSPYSGWAKNMYHGTEQIGRLSKYKDGKRDGPSLEWYVTGQKEKKATYKDGKLMTAVAWKLNGENCPVTKVVNGNGVLALYNFGREVARWTYLDGEVVGKRVPDRPVTLIDLDLKKIIAEADPLMVNGPLTQRHVVPPGIIRVEEKDDGKSAQVAKIDLDDNETRNRIIAEAIDFKRLRWGGFSARYLFSPNRQGYYSGWAKMMHDNGHVKSLIQYKDGKLDGALVRYLSDGTEESRITFKDGKRVPAQTDGIDLNDPEPLEKIFAGETVVDELRWLGKEGEELAYARNGRKPYTGWNVVFHDNGEVKHLIQYRNGKKDGLWAKWNEDGQKEGKTKYKDGKSFGLQTYWYENGQKEFEANYKDGKKTGLGTGWYENGQKKGEANYKDGRLNGRATTWYENGQKKEEANYKEGKKNRTWFLSLEDGTIIAEPLQPLKDSPNSIDETIEEIDRLLNSIDNLAPASRKVPPLVSPEAVRAEETPERQTAQVAKIDLDDPETRDRIAAEAFDGKKLLLKKDNPEIWYAPRQQTPYTGWVKWVRDNGQLEELGRYKDGKEDGIQDSWYEDGQKGEEIRYKDGKLWTASAWKPNGEKCPHTNVVNGNGVWVKYTVEGREVLRITYKNGVQDGPYTERHPNGRIHRLYQYKNGKLDGLLVSYLEDGTEYSRMTYKDGKRWVPRGQSTLQLSAVVQFLNGEVRPAGNVEFFVLRENLETVVKKAGVNLPVEQGISSAAELWARSVQDEDRYPGVAAQIRNALAVSSLARIKTNASGSGSVGLLLPGTYYLAGTAPLGTVGVVWSKPFKILSSTKTDNLKLELRDATWAQ